MKDASLLPTKEKPKSRGGVLGIINLIVLLFLVFKDYRDGKMAEPLQIRTDSVIVIKDSVVISQPTIVETISVPYEVVSKDYTPDTNYQKLVEQYKELVERFESKTIQLDSLKIDSLGFVQVTDTVSTNQIVGRSYAYSFKYPDRTKYILMPPPPDLGQFYAGGGVATNGVEGSLLYKTRRDHIYGISTGMTYDQKLIFGLRTYWKLSRR